MNFENYIFVSPEKADEYYKSIKKRKVYKLITLTWRIRNNPIFRNSYAERINRIMLEANIIQGHPEYTSPDPLKIERLIVYLRMVAERLNKNNDNCLFLALRVLEHVATDTFDARKRYLGKN